MEVFCPQVLLSLNLVECILADFLNLCPKCRIKIRLEPYVDTKLCLQDIAINNMLQAN